MGTFFSLFFLQMNGLGRSSTWQPITSVCLVKNGSSEITNSYPRRESSGIEWPLFFSRIGFGFILGCVIIKWFMCRIEYQAVLGYSESEFTPDSKPKVADYIGIWLKG